jgi:Flp pilus assembly protein TadD
MFTNKKHKRAHKALKNDDIVKAISLYNEALKESPDNCDIISDRGVAYLHAKDEKNCFTDLNRAVELQPNYSFRYACRAYAKKNFGDLDGAIQDYEKAVELDPDDPIAQNNLGMLLEEKGYQKEAEKKFKRADTLSNMEDDLLGVIQNLETGTKISNDPSTDSTDPAKLDNEEKANTAKEFKKVFTSRKQFKEFINYIKNGFRLK